VLFSPQTLNTLAPGNLRRIHHIALNVHNLQASCYFYGAILGLHELTGEEVPTTLRALVAAGKVTNFVTGWHRPRSILAAGSATTRPRPHRAFTRANHLAFDIDPQLFDQAVEVLRQNQVPLDHGPVNRQGEDLLLRSRWI